MYKYELIRCGLVQNNDLALIRPELLTIYVRTDLYSVTAKLEVSPKDVLRTGKCFTVLESAQRVAKLCFSSLGSLRIDLDGNRDDAHDS